MTGIKGTIVVEENEESGAQYGVDGGYDDKDSDGDYGCDDDDYDEDGCCGASGGHREP